jgi:hypothetical protein
MLILRQFSTFEVANGKWIQILCLHTCRQQNRRFRHVGVRRASITLFEQFLDQSYQASSARWYQGRDNRQVRGPRRKRANTDVPNFFMNCL